jgi:serine/threonine-protein kinase
MDANRWQRLEALFVGAIERDESSRYEFLRRETADDPTLYAEIAAMLEAHGEERALELEHRLLRDAPDKGSVRGPRSGDLVGPYRLLEQIGHGGMGVVYRAERADGQYTQTVAIKFVRADFAIADLVQRSRAERQILARLEHPSIARLLDGAVADDGSPYLVMEYVRGRPITEHCDDLRLTIDDRLRLFQTVCQAVHYAHQNLVVHRDLKPSNILVTPDGQVKLLDFGIAKLIANEGEATTTTALPMMTPDYASPEQVKGESITTATDVYALGLLLYELLCGERAQHAENSSPTAIARSVCETQPTSPSAAVASGSPEEISARTRARGAQRVDQLQRKLRGDLDTIVDTALRKEPARRYASAEQLRADVERYLTGLPVLARPDSVGYRAAKFVRRHKLGVIGSVVVFVSIVVGLAGAMVGLSRAREAERVALAEAATSRRVSDFLVEMFRATNPEEARGDALTARALLDRGAARIRQGLDEEPIVRARLLSTMASAYQALGLFDSAIALKEEELEIHRRDSGEVSVAYAVALGDLSDLYARRGEYERAAETAQRAVSILERKDEAVEQPLMLALNELGMAQAQSGNFDSARTALERSLEIGRRIHGGDHISFAPTLNNLAILYWQLGEPRVSRGLYERTLALLEAEYGPEHPRVAHTLNNLALALSQAGEFDSAVAVHRRVLAIREKVLEPDHPDIAETLNNLGVVMLAKRDYSAARPLFERALAMRERRLGPDHSYVATSLSNLGTTLLELKQYDAARPYLQRALESITRSLGSDHIMTSYPLLGLARIDRARGDFAAAEQGIRRVIALREAVSETHPDLAAALHELAELARERGRVAEADSLSRRIESLRTASR